VGVEKLDRRPYQNVKKSDDMSIRLHTVPALNGHTDRQVELIKQYCAVHA